jgi:hypothetical protein
MTVMFLTLLFFETSSCVKYFNPYRNRLRNTGVLDEIVSDGGYFRFRDDIEKPSILERNLQINSDLARVSALNAPNRIKIGSRTLEL